jgi:putative holliday junction resolvase
MKLFGIDYGRRRIGVAVTDENGEYIRGLPTIDRNKVPDYFRSLRSLIDSECPQRLVIGLPLDIDGDETVMSTEIRAFASELGNLVSLPVCFVDESLSSIEATALMRFRKKKDRRNKEAIDRMAACIILESFQKGLTCD